MGRLHGNRGVSASIASLKLVSVFRELGMAAAKCLGSPRPAVSANRPSSNTDSDSAPPNYHDGTTRPTKKSGFLGFISFSVEEEKLSRLPSRAVSSGSSDV